VFEARKMREVAREYKVCTQMGNQGSAGMMKNVRSRPMEVGPQRR
jgi:hypothetical protein